MPYTASDTNPIFGLLRRIDDESSQKEAVLLVNYLGIKTVEDLSSYSEPQLREHDVSDVTIGALKETMDTHYQRQFSAEAKPVAKPAPAKKPRRSYGSGRRRAASGAPPPHPLEKRVDLRGLRRILV
jgi:hypothetical protein